MRKKYGYAYKKYAYAYKIFTLAGLFKLPITEHAYFSMRMFYAWQRKKYGHGMRIFQAFIKNFFTV